MRKYVIQAFFLVHFVLYSNQSNGQKTYSIGELYNMCIEFKNYSPRDMESRFNVDDYYAVADELFADANLFKDRIGNSITTMFMGSQKRMFTIVYEMPLPSKSGLDLINKELKNTFYECYSMNEKGKTTKMYTSNGKCVFYFDQEKDKLSLSFFNNIEAFLPVLPKKLLSNQLEINSYVNSSGIFLKKGDKIKIKASGNISFGSWAGYGDPNGVDGFEQYNKIQGIRHGALVAVLGNQSPVAVGNEIIITATQDAKLYLYVNDSDPSNNGGSFVIEYSITK